MDGDRTMENSEVRTDRIRSFETIDYYIISNQAHDVIGEQFGPYDLLVLYYYEDRGPVVKSGLADCQLVAAARSECNSELCTLLYYSESKRRPMRHLQGRGRSTNIC